MRRASRKRSRTRFGGTGWRAAIIVSSFNPITLGRFREAMPEVLIGFLHEPDNEAVTIPMMKDLPHEARNPYYEEIDAQVHGVGEGRGLSRQYVDGQRPGASG